MGDNFLAREYEDKCFGVVFVNSKFLGISFVNSKFLGMGFIGDKLYCSRMIFIGDKFYSRLFIDDKISKGAKN